MDERDFADLDVSVEHALGKYRAAISECESEIGNPALSLKICRASRWAWTRYYSNFVAFSESTHHDALAGCDSDAIRVLTKVLKHCAADQRSDVRKFLDSVSGRAELLRILHEEGPDGVEREITRRLPKTA